MMKITINPAHFRAAQVHQNKDLSRHAIGGVFLGMNGDIVGTDGRSLFLAHDGIASKSIMEEDITIRLESVIPVSTEYAEFDTETLIMECFKRGAVIKRICGQVVDGKFPDYKLIIPSNSGSVDYSDTVYLTAEMLLKVSKTFGKDSVLEILSNGLNAPLTVKNSEYKDCQIVVMPCRSNKNGITLVAKGSPQALKVVA